MSKKNRIAIVKYTPYGREYVAGCSMRGIGVGDRVCLRDRQGGLHEVEVVGIQWENWVCSNHVVGHADEERFSFDFALTADTSSRTAQPSGLRLVS